VVVFVISLQERLAAGSNGRIEPHSESPVILEA